MLDRLLVLWVALLGAERIDLLGGSGAMLLTPFLVLTAILVPSGTVAIVADRGRFRVPRGTANYLVTVLFFLSIVLVSTFFSHDLSVSARRYLLLFVQVAGTFAGMILLMNRAEPERLLVRGAYVGLGICLFFNLVQLAVWLSGLEGFGNGESALYLEPGNYYGIIPRLTGSARDPNQGGLLLVTYLFLLLTLARPTRLRKVMVVLGVVSIVLTLSRSAALAGLAVCAVSMLRRVELRVSPAALLGVGSTVALLLLTPVAFPSVASSLGEPLQVLGNRLTVTEGSSAEHLDVLERAWEVSTENIKQALIGIGYGNAYTALQDIFPGNKYGNFHSLFVTLLAESGVFAFLAGVALLAYPMLRSRLYQPLVAGFIVYNMFQQSQSDPMLWLILALAWVHVSERGLPEAIGGTETLQDRQLVTSSG